MATPAKTKKAPAKKADAATKEAKKAVVASDATATAAAVKTHRKKIVVGLVVSDKMQKTIVVEIDRQVRHGLYKKYITKSRRFKAHDERNEAKIGDLVSIVEGKPISKDKRWALQKIIRQAVQTGEANV